MELMSSLKQTREYLQRRGKCQIKRKNNKQLYRIQQRHESERERNIYKTNGSGTKITKIK